MKKEILEEKMREEILEEKMRKKILDLMRKLDKKIRDNCRKSRETDDLLESDLLFKAAETYNEINKELYLICFGEE